jgi:hypothetical protein
MARRGYLLRVLAIAALAGIAGIPGELYHRVFAREQRA